VLFQSRDRKGAGIGTSAVRHQARINLAIHALPLLRRVDFRRLSRAGEPFVTRVVASAARRPLLPREKFGSGFSPPGDCGIVIVNLSIRTTAWRFGLY
jgi:hypothetical protein